MAVVLTIVKFRRNEFNTHSEFRKCIETYLKGVLYTKTVVNTQTQILIRFNKAGIEKIVSKIGDTKAIAICNLQVILINALFIEMQPDRKNRDAILNVHLYKCDAEIEGNLYVIWIYLREMRDGYFLYSLNIMA